MPRQDDSARAKNAALLEEGTLNPAPDKVGDPKFQHSDFFDPLDIVQVKYEMLRRVTVERASVTHVTEEYGVPGNYVHGANIAGFRKVGDAMLDQGLV